MADENSLLDRLVTVLEALEDKLTNASASQNLLTGGAFGGPASAPVQSILNKLNATSAVGSGSPPPLPGGVGSTSGSPIQVFIVGLGPAVLNSLDKTIQSLGKAGGGGVGTGKQLPEWATSPPAVRRGSESSGPPSIWQKIKGFASHYPVLSGNFDPEESISRGRTQQDVGWFGGNTNVFAGQMMGAMQNPSELGGFGKAIGGIGELAGKIPVVGQTIQAVGKFGEVVLESIDKLKKWNDELYRGNTQFAEYSAAMASVQMQQEFRQMQLDRDRGDRRAPSAERQAEAMNRLDQATAPLEDAWGTIKNDVSAVLSNALASVLENTGITAAAAKFTDFYNWMMGKKADDEKPVTFNEWLDQMADDRMNNQGTPSRWRN